MKLPFADVKRLAVAAQQPDANEQELRPVDEVCTASLVNQTTLFTLMSFLPATASRCYVLTLLKLQDKRRCKAHVLRLLMVVYLPCVLHGCLS